MNIRQKKKQLKANVKPIKEPKDIGMHDIEEIATEDKNCRTCKEFLCEIFMMINKRSGYHRTLEGTCCNEWEWRGW